jgi:hypothetical protein
MLEKCRLSDGFKFWIKSNSPICDRAQRRDTFLVLLSFHLLCHDDDRAVKSQALELAAALSQLEETDTQRDIGIIKGMQEIQHKNRFTF